MAEQLTSAPSSTDAAIDVNYGERYDLTIVFPRKDGGVKVLKKPEGSGKHWRCRFCDAA